MEYQIIKYFHKDNTDTIYFRNLDIPTHSLILTEHLLKI